MSDVTMILQAIGRGEAQASEELLPLIYEELRRLAALRMAGEPPNQTLQPTALVHEAWLRLSKDGDRAWRDRTHFFRAAAQAMRWILVDKARHKQSQKGGSRGERLSIDDVDPAMATIDDRILMIDQSLERLEKEDPESARLITLKFFGGLTNKEVAKVLGVTERSVERRWAYAKACLFEIVKEEM